MQVEIQFLYFRTAHQPATHSIQLYVALTVNFCNKKYFFHMEMRMAFCLCAFFLSNAHLIHFINFPTLLCLLYKSGALE